MIGGNHDSAARLDAPRAILDPKRIFGHPERAWRWLRKPKRRFDGKPPIEMLATEAGGRLVEEMIAQIDDGQAA